MQNTKIETRPLPFPEQAMSYSGTILGTRGAGKSTTARSLFEHELDKGHRCGFIDPMGDAAGIRLNPDDTPSRFQNVVIFGGPNGDLPITDEDGERVARLVANNNISFLIDLSDMIEAEQFRFMTGFADILYDEIKLPMLLLMDEAHLWAPQQTREAPSKLINRITRLNTQGRKRGIFLWLMTQRPAKINKNVISGAECLIAMRVGMPRDITVIADWLEMHDGEHAAGVKSQLPGLKNGESFVSIPLLKFYGRIQFPMPTTKDTGRTPQHGETVGGIVLPPIELGDLAAAFGATTALDPRDEEIEMLRGELSRLRSSNGRMTDEIKRVTIERNAVVETLTGVQDLIGKVIGSPRIHPAPAEMDPDDILMVLDADGEVRPMDRPTILLSRVRNGVRQMRGAIETAQVAEKLSPDDAMTQGARVLQQIGKAASTVLDGLQPAQRRIVQALASANGAPLTRDEIARLSGISPTSSNVGIKLTRLDGNGLVEKIGDDVFKFVGNRP